MTIVGKFKEGDRVRSVLYGVPGVIAKIVTYRDYVKTFPTYYSQLLYNKWIEKKFPGFQNKPLYAVLLDYPAKAIKREELEQSLPIGLSFSKEECDMIFKESPENYLMMYPEDELELTGERNEASTFGL